MTAKYQKQSSTPRLNIHFFYISSKQQTPNAHQADNETPNTSKPTATRPIPLSQQQSAQSLYADSEAPNTSKPTAKRLGPHHLPSDHKETQPFLPAVQRSADGSSNLRETTQPHTLIQPPEQPPHTLRLETPAGKACAVWRRLCRRGADS